MTTYYRLEYSSLAGGSFTEEGAFVTWNAGADSGFIVTDLPDGTDGVLFIALVGTSTAPVATDTLTQGGVTATVDVSDVLLYPAYARDDYSVTNNAGVIDIRWTGVALGATHSFFYDGGGTQAVVGEILTFATSNAQCEVITVVSATELDVRFITDLNTVGLPTDNESFTGDIGATGDSVNGAVHPRGYQPLELHRFLALLNSTQDIAGDDDLSVIDFTASERSTDQIIKLLGTANVDETVIQHMYGGSIEQGSDNTRELYSGVSINVTSPLASTIPVLFQEDAIVTEYWDNGYFPDSVAGNIRIMIKTVEDGVNIDGRRFKGKLLEFGEFYFEAETTLGFAETSLALVSSADGNNISTVTAISNLTPPPSKVEGYSTQDYGEGSGATPFGLVYDFNGNTNTETYEWTKYVQRRGTAETLFGRNAQLFTGFNINFAYDNEVGGDPTQSEILVYGTEIPYTGGTGTLVAVGDTVQGGTSLARGRVIYVDDTAGTGTIIVADSTGTFQNTEALTTLRGSGEWTATSGTVVNNANSGQIINYAFESTTTTGNVYGQLLTGVAPVDNQTLYGATSGVTLDVNGAVSTRTVNNQFVGSYTGNNFSPLNFGIAIDASDAITGDKFTNLLGNEVSPPDNRSGVVTNILTGDYITAYPYDGLATDANGQAEPNFDEMTLSTGITAVSTTIVVGATNIPNNTPSAGFLRVQRDSDSNLELIEYSSFDNATGTFTLVGTAGIVATAGNSVMRAFIDVVATADGQVSYTAQYTNPATKVAVTVRRGGSPNPIKTFKSEPEFGGFSLGTVRTPDA